MKLRYTPTAARDLLRLRRFTAKNNPLAAQKASQQLRKNIQHLLGHPELGSGRSELGDVRELIAREYIIRYKMAEQEIVILNIWHEKEDR